MNQNENQLTFGTVQTMSHHRHQLERKIESIRYSLAGRSHPLLPENWEDEDAWKLARDLSALMVRIYHLNKTVFDENNPYPDNDTPLEEIRYYNPYFPDEDPFLPPELPQGLWTHILNCGILIVAGNPSFCFPSSGTFADLENLFLGTLRSGAGPVLQFNSVLDQIQSSLSNGLERLQGLDFGPEPPVFAPPTNTDEKAHQDALQACWEEWNWLCHFPCRPELLTSIMHLQSDENFSQVQNFIECYVGLEDLLRPAIDLYLYQKGVSGMLEDSYFATYALLSRAQKQLQALLAVKEG